MSYLFRPKIGKAFLRGRNTGIIYGINFSSHLNTIRNYPFFVIGSKIKPENKNELKKIINEEFSKVKNNKIDVQAFEVIKQNIKNSEKITRECRGCNASRLHLGQQFGQQATVVCDCGYCFPER